MKPTLLAVCYMALGVVGLLLCTSSFTCRRLNVPRWTLGLLSLMGVVLVTCAALGLTTFYYHSQLPGHTAEILDYLRRILQGVFVGLFLAWVISGEFSRFLRLSFCSSTKEAPNNPV